MMVMMVLLANGFCRKVQFATEVVTIRSYEINDIIFLRQNGKPTLRQNPFYATREQPVIMPLSHVIKHAAMSAGVRLPLTTITVAQLQDAEIPATRERTQ